MDNIITMRRQLVWTIVSALSFFLAGCYHEGDFPPDEETEAGEQLSPWQKGYLDIYQFSTGRGDCAYIIMPDGTRMMIDCGDLGNGSSTVEIMTPKPNSVRTPAEWVATHVRHINTEAGFSDIGHIDYLLATHYDSDHIGNPTSSHSKVSPSGTYMMAGISELANLMTIDKIVVRDPSFSSPPTLLNGATASNFHTFLNEWALAGGAVEQFEVGSGSQFLMTRDPSSFPTFGIANLYGNGVIMSQDGTGTYSIIPSTATESQLNNENMRSCVIHLSYGDFDYHNGGDIQGSGTGWTNIENQVAPLVGETDVFVCDHHSYSDSMNATMIETTTPQVFIIPCWDYYHPQPDPLARELSTDLYPGYREVYSAGLVDANRVRLGENGEKIKPAGHIVVRVYEGGDAFQVFVLNDSTTTYDIIYQSDIFTSRK